MSNQYLEPATDHLLVVDSPREVSIDGIELPGNIRQQEMCFGTVVFAGPQVLVAKPEDLVCYGPYAGKGVVVNGIEFRLLREGQIEAYIRKSS
jgi:hypothetical protein